MKNKTEKITALIKMSKYCIASLLPLLTLCIFILSCNPFVPVPHPDPGPKIRPGSRNYIWEIDTLHMPINYISAIWGASPDELWAIGAGGTDNDRLMHFREGRWSTYTNEPIYCGGKTLFGFAADDIWMGGAVGYPQRGGGLWHYDGQKWEQNYLYTPDEDYYQIEIEEIWGLSSNNIYVVGSRGFFDGNNSWFKGFILHYNGENWCEVVKADFNSQFLRLKQDEIGNLYVFSYGINNESGNGDVEFYKVNEDSLEQIYTNKEFSIRGGNISYVDGKVYFAVGGDVFRYVDSEFENTLLIDNNKFYWKVFGRHEKDIFILMSNGFEHYNGIDIENIYEKPSSSLRFMGEPLIIGDHIYHCMRCNGFDDYVLHGYLEE